MVTTTVYEPSETKISNTSSGVSAILASTPASNAKTKYGAHLMMISTILRKTSFIASKNVFTGATVLSGRKSKVTPKKIAKKILKT